MNTGIKRAFTLIELLVVIAIIAILAAILFPVFAQAKEAAKKTQSISNQKQVATGFLIYTADNDDVFPSSYSHINGTAYGLWVGYGGAYPTGWCNDGWYRADEDYYHWSNSTEPYRKNPQITEYAGMPQQGIMGITTQRVGGPKPNFPTMGMNGLLHTLSTTAVGNQSTVPMMWTIHGKMKSYGVAYSSPYLWCPTSTNPQCVFNPTQGPQGQTTGLMSGAIWYTDGNFGDYSYWVYGKGHPITRCDSSTKMIRVGSPSQSVGNNNPFGDPFATYDSVGIEWSFYPCYAPGTTTGVSYWCYFRPDRDGYGQ